MTVLVDSALDLLVAVRILAFRLTESSSDAPSRGADEVDRRFRPLAERNRRATLPLLLGMSSLEDAAALNSAAFFVGELLSLRDGDRIKRSSYL